MLEASSLRNRRAVVQIDFPVGLTNETVSHAQSTKLKWHVRSKEESFVMIKRKTVASENEREEVDGRFQRYQGVGWLVVGNE